MEEMTPSLALHASATSLSTKEYVAIVGFAEDSLGTYGISCYRGNKEECYSHGRVDRLIARC